MTRLNILNLKAQRNNENVGKVKELHEIKFNFGVI